jgi:hypothetical protein
LRSSRRQRLRELLQLHQETVQRRHKVVSVQNVNQGWVNEQKQLSDATATDFVSTNDVLCCWFFNRFECSHATVVCNCRGRLAEVPSVSSTFVAGSYVASVLLTASDFASSAAVRRRISTVLQGGGLKNVMRVAPTSGVADRIGNCTNWTSFFHELQLPHCRHVMHFPVVDSTGDATWANLYIFRPRAGEVSALVFAPEGMESKTSIM